MIENYYISKQLDAICLKLLITKILDNFGDEFSFTIQIQMIGMIIDNG